MTLAALPGDVASGLVDPSAGTWNLGALGGRARAAAVPRAVGPVLRAGLVRGAPISTAPRPPPPPHGPPPPPPGGAPKQAAARAAPKVEPTPLHGATPLRCGSYRPGEILARSSALTPEAQATVAVAAPSPLPASAPAAAPPARAAAAETMAALVAGLPRLLGRCNGPLPPPPAAGAPNLSANIDKAFLLEAAIGLIANTAKEHESDPKRGLLGSLPPPQPPSGPTKAPLPVGPCSPWTAPGLVELAADLADPVLVLRLEEALGVQPLPSLAGPAPNSGLLKGRRAPPGLDLPPGLEATRPYSAPPTPSGLGHTLLGKQGAVAAEVFSTPQASAAGLIGGSAGAAAAAARADLPSIGSAAHASRRCKPCAFTHKEGCQSGFECRFCHLCPPGEKKQRKKERKEIRRAVRQEQH